MLTSLSF
jgi:hypothetical protein